MYERVFNFERGQVMFYLNVIFEGRFEGYDGVSFVDLFGRVFQIKGRLGVKILRLWYEVLGRVGGELVKVKVVGYEVREVVWEIY